MENQSGNINPAAMFKLSYGLFLLTARDGDKDNGCIINTAAQLTSTPLRISITVNKANFTHDMIIKTGSSTSPF
jgi:flavin reductase (DIM6/NTAB) family NADH-FMN oxidoreductase RutF